MYGFLYDGLSGFIAFHGVSYGFRPFYIGLFSSYFSTFFQLIDRF